MVEQKFNIETYWKVIVFYDVNYDLFYLIESKLLDVGITEDALDELYWMMFTGRAKAVTFSNISSHTSIILFNTHKSKRDYLDSIVHEAEHVKQAMLYAYEVEDSGEPPAYTIGHLIYNMYPAFYPLLCNCKKP